MLITSRITNIAIRFAGIFKKFVLFFISTYLALFCFDLLTAFSLYHAEIELSPHNRPAKMIFFRSVMHYHRHTHKI